MALLNIASQFKDIYLGSDYNKALIFTTSDKHIITHGVDFLADYNNDNRGTRGFVPSYTSEDNNLIFGRTGWTKIVNSMLPIASNLQANEEDTIFNSKQVQELITNGFAANDAMVFKGVLVKAANANDAANKFVNVPKSNYSAGWVYRVEDAGTYLVNTVCEQGDWIIATVDRGDEALKINGEDSIDATQWSVIQTNINGTVNITINGTEYSFASNKNVTVNQGFYAPTRLGAEGDVLTMTSSSTLGWKAQSTLAAGTAVKLTSSAGSATKPIYFNDGKPVQCGDSLAVNITGTAAIASKVANALTLGAGFYFDKNNASDIIYDGSAAKTLTLSPATKTAIGGVKIDNAENATISVSEDGRISLTQQNIYNALGYIPTAPDEVMTYNIVNKTEDGIVPKMSGTNLSTDLINSSYYLLAFHETTSSNPKWHKLSSDNLSNTWRPVWVDDTQVLTDANTSNALKLRKGNNITLAYTNGEVVISATDTTYNVVDGSNNGLMSVGDKQKLDGIESGAQVNQNAFSKISFDSGSALEAASPSHEITFHGSNIKIERADVNNSTINFAVDLMTGASANAAGKAGLVPAPAQNTQNCFLKGDGTWDVPQQRGIKVGSNTLSTNGDLTIEGTGGVSVSLDATNKKLTITSTALSGGSGITVTQGAISLNEATTTTIGGIKTALAKLTQDINIQQGTASDRFYGVQLDKNGKAVVNVPWENDSVRDIQVGGTSIGKDVALNFVVAPQGSIGIVASADMNSSNGDVYDIGFDLFWYNLDDNSYETT